MADDPHVPEVKAEAEAPGSRFLPELRIETVDPEHKDFAAIVVEAAGQLLTKIAEHSPLLRSAFQLELHYVDPTWQLSARLNVINMFESRLPKDPKKLVAFVQEANEYVSGVLSKRPDSDEFDDPLPTPPRKLCFRSDCTCARPHAAACRHQIAKDQPCGFAHNPELILRPLDIITTPFGYTVLRREKDGTRDLLVQPKIGDWRPRPHSNEEMVRSEEFWKCIQALYINIKQAFRHHPVQGAYAFDHLSKFVSSVSLNFGSWETAISRDPSLISCHGHAHFTLSRAAVDHLRQYQSWKFLNDCLRTPTDEYYKDCQLLLSTRINSLLITNVSEKVDGLATQVDGLATQVDGLATQVTELKTQVAKDMDDLKMQVAKDVGDLKSGIQELKALIMAQRG